MCSSLISSLVYTLFAIIFKSFLLRQVRTIYLFIYLYGYLLFELFWTASENDNPTAFFLYRKGDETIKIFLCKPFFYWNEYPLSFYPESLKSLPFGVDLTLLLEQYIGQHTTIARKLCLQLFRHFRHKSLYVLLPVLGLMK